MTKIDHTLTQTDTAITTTVTWNRDKIVFGNHELRFTQPPYIIYILVQRVQPIKGQTSTPYNLNPNKFYRMLMWFYCLTRKWIYSKWKNKTYINIDLNFKGVCCPLVSNPFRFTSPFNQCPQFTYISILFDGGVDSDLHV